MLEQAGRVWSHLELASDGGMRWLAALLMGSICSTASALSVVSAVDLWRPISVSVAVYYETLCPCCQAFITQQLLPAYETAPELIDLTLVPYGNAQTTKTSKGYEFVCQHGPAECQGNKIHSCAVKYVTDKLQQLRYVACMISDDTDPEGIARQCAQLMGIPLRPILRCARGREGSQLLKANGDLTEALGPERDGVPAITFNGECRKKAEHYFTVVPFSLDTLTPRLEKEPEYRHHSQTGRPISCNKPLLGRTMQTFSRTEASKMSQFFIRDVLTACSKSEWYRMKRTLL